MGKIGTFICGGLVGATLALLLAPRTGEETRALLAEKADECCGKGQTWYDQGKVYIKESVSNVQPTINKKGDELRQKIENARTLIAEQVAKNASAARDVINDKVPVAADKINQAADVVRGRIDTAADALKQKVVGEAGAADADAAEAAVAEAGEAVAPVADEAVVAEPEAASPAGAASPAAANA